jgi:ribonuclease P protein component
VKPARPALGLPKRARLRRPEEFRLALRSRRRRRGRWFTLSVAARQADASRLGVVVGGRVVPKAVERNRLKRMVREVFRLASPNLPAVDLVFQIHAIPARDVPDTALREELLALLEWSRK